MRKANLMLHTGANTVTREEVGLVQTPERTKSWVPVPHARLVDEVEGYLKARDMTIVNEAHALARNGQRYFGLMQVANGHNPDDFGLVVGIRNSHDKSFPAGLCLGGQVFVCDNLSFSGEIKLARKHTSWIERDLPALVGRAVGMLTDLRSTQESRFNTYKKHELTRSQGNDLIIEALERKVIGCTHIPDVVREWKTPKHPEFAVGGFTAWRLFNAFTDSLKDSLITLPKRTTILHGMLDTVCSGQQLALAS